MTELYVPAPDGRANSTSIPTTATVDVRPVDAAHGVIITVSGPLMSDGVDLVQEHLGAGARPPPSGHRARPLRRPGPVTPTA